MKHYELKIHVTEDELKLVYKTLGEIIYYKQAKNGYWTTEEDNTIRWYLTETEKNKTKVLLSSDADELNLTMLSMGLAMANKKEE